MSAAGMMRMMSRVNPDDLSNAERVFIAWSLRVAQRAEALLTSSGVLYAVEVEEMGRTFLFGSPRHAAVFYVAADQASYCRSHLAAAGFGKGVVED